MFRVTAAARPAERPAAAGAPAPPLQAAPCAPQPWRFIRRHAVLAYFVLVIALSWGALLPVTRGPLSASGNDRTANPLFLLAMLAAPLAGC